MPSGWELNRYAGSSTAWAEHGYRGVVVGLVVAAGLGRFMSSILFGVESMDPAAYAAAIGVIGAAAALASYVPARRAAAIDPIETLRAE